MDPKQRFHRHVADSVAVLQDQISQLEAASAVAGERQEAIDHVLTGITKLQNEVSDAADTTPSYDRKQYSETIKGLQDQFSETVARVTPKSRFRFKRSTLGSQHVDMGAPENDPRLNPGSLSRNPHASHSGPFQPLARERESAAVEQGSSPMARDYNEELSKPGSSDLRKPSFSTAEKVGIADQAGLHIILPSSAARATSSASLMNLRNCIVDMSIPTSHGMPFPSLILKSIVNSLIIAGRVDGPVHITDVTGSIVVATARQVRMHDCKDVDVYLHCGSHPIIEDCRGIRFATLPRRFVTEQDLPTENQWNNVDDFKWLKAGPSPNWTTLPQTQVLGDEIWTKVVPGWPGASVEETLGKVGLPRRDVDNPCRAQVNDFDL